MMDGAPSAPAKWTDLVTRIGSALVLVVVGVIGVWFGGFLFHAIIAVFSGLMVWELVRMLQPLPRNLAIGLGVAGGIVMMIAASLTLLPGLTLICLLAVAGWALLNQHKLIFASYSVAVLVGGYGILAVRDHMPVGWILWLLIVVVATDVAGYFAGRSLGGPKFWPRVSPKKTWSGTIAGWGGAAVVGAVFALGSDQMLTIILLSVVLSFASQLGDIAESAIKRRMGVKDSSDLIPGHGGVLDRFDGMLGASLLLLIFALVFGFPPGLQ